MITLSTKHSYLRVREQQMQQFQRKLTPLEFQASLVVFDGCQRAEEAVRSGSRSTAMQVISLGTGLGKSTSTHAFIARRAMQDPEFSTAFVVPTIRMAIEAQAGIEKLLGEGTTTLWSSLHRHKGGNERAAREELGFVPTRLVNREDLPTSRILIVTHSLLKEELKGKPHIGVTRYCGSPRSVVIIDEHPDLVDTVTVTPATLQTFHDELAQLDPTHPWLPVVAAIVPRMAAFLRTTGQKFCPSPLLSADEAKVFEDSHGLDLWEATDEEQSTERRQDRLKDLHCILGFLRAAGRGNAFYSRAHQSFHAYQLHFDNGYPGFVLLDATSDILGYVGLHPNAHLLDVPMVDYSPLEVAHIEMDDRFRRKENILKNRALGREYAEFIIKAVIANTEPGSDVLVVLWKAILTQELLPSSDDPAQPMDWDGRKVNTQHWGSGIGSNQFRGKTHVFLFGDHHLPAYTTVATTHAWSGVPLQGDTLSAATSLRDAGSVYMMGGIYRKPQLGQLLSAFKQLAMRGKARNVDEQGRCLPMKLFTTMPLQRLLPAMPVLFPGAPQPSMAKPPEGTLEKSMEGRQGLLRLLMETQSVSRLSAEEVMVVTGIPTAKLAREFKGLKELPELLGWRLITAKELGLAGRMTYLIHDRREAELSLKAA